MATVRSNHIIDSKRTPLSNREEALRRLCDPQFMIEVLSTSAQLDISDFVLNRDISVLTHEYRCIRCGAHAIIRCITSEGTVRCCGSTPIVGKPL